MKSIELTPEIVEQLGFRPDKDGWLVLKAVTYFYIKPLPKNWPDEKTIWRFRTHAADYSKEFDCYIPEHNVEEIDEIMMFIFDDAYEAGKKDKQNEIKKAILGED